jgi:hypothetical protein
MNLDEQDELHRSQSVLHLPDIRSELDMILDAIRLIDGEVLNSEIVKEIRSGSSYQSILTTASRIVNESRGF